MKNDSHTGRLLYSTNLHGLFSTVAYIDFSHIHFKYGSHLPRPFLFLLTTWLCLSEISKQMHSPSRKMKKDQMNEELKTVTKMFFFQVHVIVFRVSDHTSTKPHFLIILLWLFPVPCPQSSSSLSPIFAYSN